MSRPIYAKLDEKTEVFKPRITCVHYPYLWQKECELRYGDGPESSARNNEACKGQGPVDTYPGMYTGFPVNFEYTQAGQNCGNEEKKNTGIY